MSRALAARNQLGAIKRHHPHDEAAITAARRELAEAKIAEYILRTVDAAPPLTPEQRSRLADLLGAA
jgi:hypothetical protein